MLCSPNLLIIPIIVGTDVPNRRNVTYVRARDQQYLIREPRYAHDVMCTISTAQVPFKASLTDQNLSKVLNLFKEFSNFFISWTATSTVYRCSAIPEPAEPAWEPVGPVPYRLSCPEILKVREIIIGLLEKGYKRTVAYFSKGTQVAEPRYHSYELETLSVVKALQNIWLAFISLS